MRGRYAQSVDRQIINMKGEHPGRGASMNSDVGRVVIFGSMVIRIPNILNCVGRGKDESECRSST